MRAVTLWTAVVLFALTSGALSAEFSETDLGIRVPEGFEISLFASDELAHDIFSMTIDAQGRVVVAGLNYVKILHDDDGDGRAELASLYSDKPASGAHGMYFDGPDLICTGDNSVMRLIDRDADGVADKSQVWTSLRHPEHGANGVVKGPDGWYSIICGNDAGITEQHAVSAKSSVKQPRCGGAVRISPDGKTTEVFAHGFRNPYDCDFDAAGRLLTVDSDGERDHYLPWYTPTRLFDVTQGREHGWLLSGWTRSWSRPEWFYDNVERAAELGRGSPTGVKVYRHRQFPERYRSGVFSACWTLGRVYFVPLEETGASVAGEPEIFMETTGDTGFAPVDLAVGPDGDMYVAIGGRRTRGSVFRVRYKAGPKQLPMPATDLQQVLAADQPLSSWSRAAWVPLARKLGATAFEQAAANEQLTSAERVRAVEVLVELFGGLDPSTAIACVGLNDPALSARVAWALSLREANREISDLLATLTHDDRPVVQRAAWEAIEMLQFGDEPALQLTDFAWRDAFRSVDRRVRQAAMSAAAKHLRPEARKKHLDMGDERHILASQWIDGFDLVGAMQVFGRTSDSDVRLEAVRLMQLALGDLHIREGLAEVYSGYQADVSNRGGDAERVLCTEVLAAAFPTEDIRLDREIARTLGMIGNPVGETLERLTEKWTESSTVEDDIHYLIVLSLLPGERSAEVTRQTATALAWLHLKLREGEMTPSRNWPLRVGEAFDELVRRDPALPNALAEAPSFGLPEHGLFASRLKGKDAQVVARALLERVVANDDVDWTSELVDALKVLPFETIAPHLRERWDDYSLRDSIALALAVHAEPEDREALIEALSSVQSNVVEVAANALTKVDQRVSAADIAAAMKALKQQTLAPKARSTRHALVALLRHWTRQQITVTETVTDAGGLEAAYKPWFEWFKREYPDAAKAVVGTSAADWTSRLNSLDWESGNAARGNLVFEKLSCHRCHRGQSRLGPDLAGAAGRFSSMDLFAAILDPNKEVAPTYQTMQVVTRNGEVHTGLVVYESPESTLLQTGPDTTIRITGVQSQRPSATSIMPTGLLNDATDQEVADLHAYLKTLTK